MWEGQDLSILPKRDWKKTMEYDFDGYKIFSVKPQAHLIGVTQAVGMLEGYSMDAILVKAFEKNYMTASKPKVVETYGFEQMHGEPLELVNFTFECIYDRACEGEMNRYRVGHSKNYESGRYVDYVKKGLTIVFPDDVTSEEEVWEYIHFSVLPSLIQYDKAVKNGAKREAARRRLTEARAVESVHTVNLRTLYHMARQRSRDYSPNGREAEAQISAVVTAMLESIKEYLPRFYETLVNQVGKGYR
jgi:thymidylate synthase ThyX